METLAQPEAFDISVGFCPADLQNVRYAILPSDSSLRHFVDLREIGVCQFLQRDDGFKMRIKIVQHLFQPFQFQLVGWNKFCKIILVFAENHTENFTEKPLDLQLITEGLLIKEGFCFIELLDYSPGT